MIRKSLSWKWLILALAPVLLLTACEDSYLMRKIKKPKEEKSAPIVPAAAPKEEVPTQPEVEAPAEKSDVAAIPAAEEPPPEPPATAQDLINKTNAYVACINRTRPRTVQSKERYLSWVDEKKGPTCKERYIAYGIYSLYDDGIQKCNQAAEKGAQMDPSLPLIEEPAKKLAVAYETLVPLVQSAQDYYQQQDYKDDNCAKAKEMHPKLMAAFQNYLEAEEELSNQLKPIKKEMSQKELIRLEQEGGKTLPWHIKKVSISAETLMEKVPEDPKTKINSEDFLQAFGVLEIDFQNFESYSKANPEEEKKVLMFSMFFRGSKEFYTQAKLLKRELAAGKPDPKTVSKFIQEYNALVQNSNSLIFR